MITFLRTRLQSLNTRRTIQAQMGLAFGGLTLLFILLFIGILQLATQVNRFVFASGSDLAVHQLQQAVLIYGLFLTVYFIALGWVTAGRITEPIKEIAAVANRIYQGEVELEIPVMAGEDEVAALSRSLNQLLTELNGQRAALQTAKAELEERVVERTRKLSTLYDILQLASAQLDLPVFVEGALKRVLVDTPGRAGMIHLLDKSGELLELMSQQGLNEPAVGRIARIEKGSDLFSELVVSHRPVVVADISADGRTAALAGRAGAYLGLPIRTSGKTWGVLSVMGMAAEPFREEELDLLGSMANQLGIAVERFYLRQQAEQLAVVEERNRLARQLHDSVTQSLYSATLLAEAGRRMAQAGKMDKALHYMADVSESNQQALKEMRLLVHKLRPSLLEKAGLLPALEQRLKAVEARVGIQYQLLVDGAVQLKPEVEEALYHIAQESLNNALKHARSSKVAVRLEQVGDEVRLWVIDNGKGFEVEAAGAAGGLGLTSMREWAGQLGGTVTFRSTVGEGTIVAARLKAL